jgi:hypothetical protein
MGKKWIDVVKEQFRLGKKMNPAYSLKDAMGAAKPIYKKLKNTVDTTVEVGKAVTQRKFFEKGKSGKRKSGKRKPGKRKSRSGRSGRRRSGRRRTSRK